MAKEPESKFEKSDLDQSLESEDDKLQFSGIHKSAMAYLQQQVQTATKLIGSFYSVTFLTFPTKIW